MVQLNSSAVVAVDYDPASRLLFIWFPDNGPYTFYDVPPPIFHGLIAASSPGQFYNAHIRGRYSR